MEPVRRSKERERQSKSKEGPDHSATEMNLSGPSAGRAGGVGWQPQPSAAQPNFSQVALDHESLSRTGTEDSSWPPSVHESGKHSGTLSRSGSEKDGDKDHPELDDGAQLAGTPAVSRSRNKGYVPARDKTVSAAAARQQGGASASAGDGNRATAVAGDRAANTAAGNNCAAAAGAAGPGGVCAQAERATAAGHGSAGTAVRGRSGSGSAGTGSGTVPSTTRDLSPAKAARKIAMHNQQYLLRREVEARLQQQESVWEARQHAEGDSNSSNHQNLLLGTDQGQGRGDRDVGVFQAGPQSMDPDDIMQTVSDEGTAGSGGTGSGTASAVPRSLAQTHDDTHVDQGSHSHDGILIGQEQQQQQPGDSDQGRVVPAGRPSLRSSGSSQSLPGSVASAELRRSAARNMVFRDDESYHTETGTSPGPFAHQHSQPHAASKRRSKASRAGASSFKAAAGQVRPSSGSGSSRSRSCSRSGSSSRSGYERFDGVGTEQAGGDAGRRYRQGQRVAPEATGSATGGRSRSEEPRPTRGKFWRGVLAGKAQNTTGAKRGSPTKEPTEKTRRRNIGVAPRRAVSVPPGQQVTGVTERHGQTQTGVTESDRGTQGQHVQQNFSAPGPALSQAQLPGKLT